ncbi:type IV secretory system conjugative DNA transfer family protein [Klebsiella quasipneumoniae]|uniref:type IV secretory system conjugative DNA transfer family protein n=1 Tax=Klebsiella quasipneumoniae TaxID=1463165 RepID=UPI00388EA04B
MSSQAWVNSKLIQESLAFLAGYLASEFYLICRDINQLRSRETGYGRMKRHLPNCHVQNAYPPNRTETAEHLSLTGQTTVIQRADHNQRETCQRDTGWRVNCMQEVQRPC